MQHQSVNERMQQLGNMHIGNAGWTHALALTVSHNLHSADESQHAAHLQPCHNLGLAS